MRPVPLDVTAIANFLSTIEEVAPLFVGQNVWLTLLCRQRILTAHNFQSMGKRYCILQISPTADHAMTTKYQARRSCNASAALSASS